LNLQKKRDAICNTYRQLVDVGCIMRQDLPK
jgi:hypothetical protein